MVQITEQLAALSKSQLDAVLNTAALAADNAEKLADLQLKAGKAAYEDAVKALRQVAAVKDVTELASYTTAAAQPAWDKAAAYAKSAYEVVAAAQAEYAALVEEQVAEFNKNVVVTLDAALKSAPAGSEGAVSAVKSAVHSANTVYESFIKAAKQVNTIAEANMAAVGAQVATAGKKKAAA
jgi:phasin family protein